MFGKSLAAISGFVRRSTSTVGELAEVQPALRYLSAAVAATHTVTGSS